jgi:hypothetical protein
MLRSFLIIALAAPAAAQAHPGHLLHPHGVGNALAAIAVAAAVAAVAWLLHPRP